jgi:hypothetical protein
LAATKIIEHYNWVWAEMTPTEGIIKVVNTEEYLGEII